MEQKHGNIRRKAAAGLLALLITAGMVPAESSFSRGIVAVSAGAEGTGDIAEAASALLTTGLSVSSRNICLRINVEGIEPDKDTVVSLDGNEIGYTPEEAGLSLNFEFVPKKIADIHELTVKSGDKVLLDKSISAKELLKELSDNDSSQRQAAENLLRYGSAAQKYFDSGETVSDGDEKYTGTEVDIPTQGFDNASFNSRLREMDAPVTYDGMSLCFDERLTLKMIFSPAEGHGTEDAEAFIRSNIGFRESSSEVSRNGNRVCVIKHDIGIRELEKQFDLRVGDEDISVSAVQFIANVMAEKDNSEEIVELKELCMALYSLYSSVKSAPENYAEPVKDEAETTSSTSSSTSSATTTTTTTTTTTGSSSNEKNDPDVTKPAEPAEPSGTDFIIPTKKKGIYSFRLSDNITSTPYMSINGDKILLNQPRYDEESTLHIYDLKTGEMLAEKLLSPWDDMAYKEYTLLDDCVIEREMPSIIRYYDLSLEEQKAIDLKSCSDNIYYCDVMAFSDSGRYIFFSSYKNTGDTEFDYQMKCYIYDSEKDTFNEVKSDEHIYEAKYSTDGDCFIGKNVKNDTVRIDIDGTVTKDESGNAQDGNGGKNIVTERNGMYVSENGDTTAKFVYYDKENEPPYYNNERYAVSLGRNLRVYDLENDLVSDPFTLGGVSSIILSDDNMIYSVGRENNGDPFLKVVRIEELDINNELRVEKNIDITSRDKTLFKDPYGDDEELDAILKEIHDRYNVRIFFELNRHMNNKWDGQIYDSYYGERVRKAELILDYLSNWPEDICRQLTDEGSEMWILVCEEFHPETITPENIDPAAQATSEDGRPMIIIEAYDSMDELFVQNLSHEFIHELNRRFDYEDYMEWTSLSPEDGYKDSFENYFSLIEYTTNYENDLSDVYFIDGYGRVNSEEDRARIGEFLWQSYVNGVLYSAYGSEHVREKAEFLIRKYREKYSCLAEIEEGELYLEKALTLPLEEYVPYTADEDGSYSYG